MELETTQYLFAVAGTFLGYQVHRLKAWSQARDDAHAAQMRSEKWAFYRLQNDIADTDNQMRFIDEANLWPEKPVNKEAYKVLVAVEQWVDKHYHGYRVFAEASLGAFIRASTDEARRSFSGKRADFLIVDAFGKPFLVVEYDGSGHRVDPEKADALRAVKEFALKKARIPLVIIPERASYAYIWQVLRRSVTA